MVNCNGELIGNGSEDDVKFPNIPLGIWLENTFLENTIKYGDTQWLVRNIFTSIYSVLITHLTENKCLRLMLQLENR